MIGDVAGQRQVGVAPTAVALAETVTPAGTVPASVLLPRSMTKVLVPEALPPNVNAEFIAVKPPFTVPPVLLNLPPSSQPPLVTASEPPVIWRLP